MIMRESIVREIESRLWTVNQENGDPLDVALVVRNPGEEITTFPAVALFEGTDKIIERKKRGVSVQPICLKRRLKLLFGFWREAVSDHKATMQAIEFYGALRRVLFSDGGTLGGLCEMEEIELSRVFKPRGEQKLVGMELQVDCVYMDNFR